MCVTSSCIIRRSASITLPWRCCCWPAKSISLLFFLSLSFEIKITSQSWLHSARTVGLLFKKKFFFFFFLFFYFFKHPLLFFEKKKTIFLSFFFFAVVPLVVVVVILLPLPPEISKRNKKKQKKEENREVYIYILYNEELESGGLY